MLKHTFCGKIALLKTSVFVRISSLTFLLRVYFSLKDRKAWNDSVSLESYIMAEDVYARGHNIF